MLSIVMLVLDIHPKIEGMTKEAIRFVRKNTSGPYELTVVLNGPPLNGGFRDIPKIDLLERASIAKAYNKGFSVSQGDYFCCLHNDVLVPEGWNIELQKEADNGNIAFPKLDEEGSDDPTPSWMPPGCCFVFKRELWDRLEGYDEQFEDFHCEDTDLFHRALKLGAKLIQCDVTVKHLRGQTRFLLPDKGKAILIRNTKLLLWKHRQDSIFEDGMATFNLPALSKT